MGTWELHKYYRMVLLCGICTCWCCMYFVFLIVFLLLIASTASNGEAIASEVSSTATYVYKRSEEISIQIIYMDSLSLHRSVIVMGAAILFSHFLQNFHFSIFYNLIKRTDDLISVKRVSSYRSAFTVHRKLRFILYKLILYFFAPFCYCHGCNHFVQSFFTKFPVIETDTIKFRIKTNWYITSG